MSTPTSAPTQTRTSTPGPTPTRKPTATPVPTATESSSGSGIENLLLTGEEIASVFPLGGLGCIANMFKNDASFAGTMCFVNSQAIGAEDATTLLITLSPEKPAEAEPGQDVSLPKDVKLPAGSQLVKNSKGAYTFTASESGYNLMILLTDGVDDKVIQPLSELALQQFEKIERVSLNNLLNISTAGETWSIYPGGYSFIRPALSSVRAGEYGAELNLGTDQLSIYFRADPVAKNVSLTQAFTNLTQEMAQILEGFKPEEPGEISIQGAAGLQAGFSSSADIPRQGMLVYLAHQPGWGLNIICMASRQEWQESGSQGCEKVLNSLVFFEPQNNGCEVSQDPGYGFKKEQAIQVGGGAMMGPAREYNYMNALLGPNGEAIEWERKGSLEHGSTILDVYEITYPGLKQPITFYIDEYDYADLFAPLGFTCAYPFPFLAP
jgi:hypothetical protein